jgi:hypothetical protein
MGFITPYKTKSKSSRIKSHGLSALPTVEIGSISLFQWDYIAVPISLQNLRK